MQRAVYPGRDRITLASLAADVLLVMAWTTLRGSVCVPHTGTLEHFLAFDAPMPFAARVLTPLLAWPLAASGWLTARQAFLVIDALGFLCFLGGLRYAMRALVTVSFSRVGAFVVPLLMVPAIFISAEYPPIFFPYDMTSIAFLAWGIGFVLRQRAGALALLLPFATLNRETAILLPIAWFLLWWDRLPVGKSIKTGGLVLAAFAVPRTIILFLTRHQPQPFGGSLPLAENGTWIVDSNIGWLLHPTNLALWIALLGFVPILLPALARQLPDTSRRLLVLLLFHLAALGFSGKLDEARIYAEWITLAGVLLAPAAAAWCGLPPAGDPLLNQPVRPALWKASAFCRKWAIAFLFIVTALAYVLIHLRDTPPPPTPRQSPAAPAVAPTTR